jgi:hypothetical protein
MLCTAMLAAQAAPAREPPQPASGVKAPPVKPQHKPAGGKALPALDAEFLDFLANWDSEDESWNEYLASLRGEKEDAPADGAQSGKDKPKDKPRDKAKSAARAKNDVVNDTVKRTDDNG